MNSTISVLYVDDEPELLMLGKIYLERTGNFEVSTANGGKEALRLLSETEYDIIVSDYQMPGMDGLDLLKALKSIDNPPPFILFTGRGREEVAIEALNNGADFYLQKGGDPKSQFAELSNKIQHSASRKRAEKEVLDLQRRQSDIINFLPDATFAIDTDHVVIAWNRAMEDLTGIAESDILGKGEYGYSVPFYKERRPVLLDFVLDPNEDLFLNYPNVPGGEFPLSTEVHIPGFRDTRDVTFWLTASPLYDTRGRVIGAIESIRDITQQKEAQRLLKESESRYRLTLDASNEGIWDWNLKTGDTFFSPHWFTMLGYEPDAFPGTYETWERLIHPDDLKPTKKRILEHINKKEDGYSVEFRMRTRSGDWKWILGKGNVIEWDEKDAPVRIVGTHTDITGLKQIEEKLRLDESRLETLLTLTGMSERPVNEIIGYAMEEGVRLTESSLGYVAFLNEDETVLTMHAWSDGSMEQCRISDKPIVYPVPNTGLWGEPVRQRRSVITNDYSAPDLLKKGMPDGHVSITRHLGVPIFDQDHIVLIIGVANKDGEYGDEEIRQLTLLMSGVWNILQRKKADEALLRSNEELSAAYEELAATEEELRAQYEMTTTHMEQIQRSEGRFRAIFDSSLVGLAITSPDGTWLYFNKELCSMLGYKAEELRLMTWGDLTPPEDIDEEMKLYRSVLEGADPGRIEKRYIHKDGSLVDVLISTAVVRKGDGSIDYLSSVILDITDRKKAEQFLRETEKQQHDLIEHLLDPVIILGFDGSVKYANPAAFSIFEINPESDVSSLHSSSFLTANSQSLVEEDLKGIAETGGPVINEYEIITKNGKMRTIEAAGHRVRWSGEYADLVSIRDITDRKVDKDALLQANRKLTILSSITRHDILNQVTGLLGYLELLEDTVPDESDKGYIKRCLSITNTIRSQIAFTKLVDDIRIKSLSWQYAQQMVERVLKGYHIAPVTCQTELSGLYLFADPILEKVIFTLIENSIRHGEHVSTIRFSFITDEQRCIFLYEDDGAGIPDDEKESIFDQGYGKHTGLGLFLIREILGINGMEIKETGSFGTGVRFEILVPAGKWMVKKEQSGMGS